MPTDSDWKELERSLGMSESNVNATYRPDSREGSKLAGRADLWWGGGLLETDANFDVSGFCAVQAVTATTIMRVISPKKITRPVFGPLRRKMKFTYMTLLTRGIAGWTIRMHISTVHIPIRSMVFLFAWSKINQ